MLQWLSIDVWKRVIEGRGQRRREEVTALWGEQQRRSQVLQHHQLPEPQNYSTVTWGREGGRGEEEEEVENDFDPDWSLQHDCLAFSRGIKRWQGRPENLFFALLHIWLRHVLSLYKDMFLSSMQIYSVWIFYDFFVRLTESAAHSWDFPFFSFSGFARVSGVTDV